MRTNKEAQEYIFKKALKYKQEKKQKQRMLFLSSLCVVVITPLIAISLSLTLFTSKNPIINSSTEDSEMTDSISPSSTHPESSAHSYDRIIYGDTLLLPTIKNQDSIIKPGQIEWNSGAKEAFEKHGDENTLFHVIIGASKPYLNIYNEAQYKALWEELLLEGYGAGEIRVAKLKEREKEFTDYFGKILPYLSVEDYTKKLFAQTVENLFRETFEKSGAPKTWEENNLTLNSSYYEIEKVILREKEIFKILSDQYSELRATEQYQIYQNALQSLSLEVNEVKEYCFTAYLNVSDIEELKKLPFGMEILLLPKDVTNDEILSKFSDN